MLKQPTNAICTIQVSKPVNTVVFLLRIPMDVIPFSVAHDPKWWRWCGPSDNGNGARCVVITKYVVTWAARVLHQAVWWQLTALNPCQFLAKRKTMDSWPDVRKIWCSWGVPCGSNQKGLPLGFRATRSHRQSASNRNRLCVWLGLGP